MASIRKRGKNSYQIIVSNGYDINGKKLTETKTVKRPPGFTDKQWDKEIEKIALEFERQVETGQYLEGSKMTFAEFVDKWIKDYASKELAPKTFHRYQELLSRIIPALGHIRLDKMQPTHLIEFYSNLKEKGIRLDSTYIAKTDVLRQLLTENGLTEKDLSEKADLEIRTVHNVLGGNSVKYKTAAAISKALNTKLERIFNLNGEPAPLSDQTIKHHHRLISAILQTAVHWQLLLTNPASRIKAPKVENHEAAHYDEDTAVKMLELLEYEPLKYKTMIYITFFAGCRLGELDGLEWSDINFENKLIRIRQASQYIPGLGTFHKAPKNESSSRIIAMPDSVMNLLKEYKVWWNAQKLKLGDLWYKDEEGRESDRLFIQWNGKPIHPSTPSHWFRKFCVKYSLPELKFHGLRHTNASLLISEGVDVQTIAKRLGHSKATTTTSIYSHFLRKPDRESAEKLEALFKKKKDGSKLSKQG